MDYGHEDDLISGETWGDLDEKWTDLDYENTGVHPFELRG
jgi:hypothetical protein